MKAPIAVSEHPVPVVPRPVAQEPAPWPRPESSASDPGGFPRAMLSLLRCVVDAGELALVRETASAGGGIHEGALRCVRCGREYPIESGIARLIGSEHTWETGHEMGLKDREYEAMPDAFVPPDIGWRSRYMDAIEIPPHLAALAIAPGNRMLEVGCGDGRFTVLSAQMGAEVLAVDFSLWALRRTQRNLAAGEAPSTFRLRAPRSTGNLTGRVGLVQADASCFQVAPRSFDRVLSATPLDSRDERMKMYSVIAEALRDNGRYVAGVEYDDLHRRLLGLPVLRRYSEGGILIEHLSVDALSRELAPYFGHLRMRPVRVRLPLAAALPLHLRIAAARIAAALPGLRQMGEILLATATSPRRLPQDGVRRSGNPLFTAFYRRYRRARGQAATWTPGDGAV